MADQSKMTSKKGGLRIILHLGDVYPGDGPNVKRMRVFCDYLTRRGHKVLIFASPAGKRPERVKNVCFCPAVPLKSKSNINRALNGVSYGISSVIMAMRLKKVDVVVTTCPPALICPFGWMIAKLKKAALVYDVRDIWPDLAWEMGSFRKESAYSKVFAFIRDFMLGHSDLVTAVSDGKMRKLRGYCPDKDMVKVPNGFDEGFLENREIPEVVERYRLDDAFSCVFAGNIGLAQGLEQLLYVAGRAKEKGIPAQFHIFGSGVEEENLKQMARREGLDNVRFEGRISGGEVYTVLRHAKMSFVPLVNERLTDSIPTKLYECLGVGCPVLLAAEGDAVAVLEESGLGIAVRPNDGEALWKGFLQMYGSMDEILRNRERAMELMKKEHSLQKSAEVLERELSSRFGRPGQASAGAKGHAHGTGKRGRAGMAAQSGRTRHERGFREAIR